MAAKDVILGLGPAWYVTLQDGDLNDQTSLDLDLTAFNNPPYESTGRFTGYPVLNGSNQYFRTNGSTGLNNATVAVSVFVKFDEEVTPKGVFMARGSNTESFNGRAFAFYIESNFTVRFRWFAGSSAKFIEYDATFLTDGAWHHILAQHASTGATEIWVDGVLVASSTDVSNVNSQTDNLYIGSIQDATSVHWVNGSIAHPAMWHRMLSETEIAELAAASDEDSSSEIIVEGIPSAEAFGTPTITVGGVTIAVDGIDSEEAFGEPTIILGSSFITPESIPSAEAFGTPTIVPGGVTVSVDGIPSAEAFGQPAFVTGDVVIAPIGIPSAEAFGTPTITVGEVTVSVEGIPSAEAFEEPVVRAIYVITLDGIPSGEAFGNPTILVGEAVVKLEGIPSAEAFGQPTVRLSFSSFGFLVQSVEIVMVEQNIDIRSVDQTIDLIDVGEEIAVG